MNTFISRDEFLPAGCTPDFGEKQGELKNKYENQWVFHGFEVLATCRFLTAGPTTPLASLKLELWHLSFCNVKTCNQLTGTVLDNCYIPTEQSHKGKSWISWPAPLLLSHSGEGLLQPACAGSWKEKHDELKKPRAARLQQETLCH